MLLDLYGIVSLLSGIASSGNIILGYFNAKLVYLSCCLPEQICVYATRELSVCAKYRWLRLFKHCH